MSKKSKLLIITGCSIIALFALFAIPWLIIYGGIWLSPDPPKPQIAYGEFPFELVYSLDGEILTINDVFVCEYDGIEVNEGTGKEIKWKSYLKSTNQENLILYQENDIKIICSIGTAEYYMSEPEYYEIFGDEENSPILSLYQDYGSVTSSHVLSDGGKEKYKIELISWKFSKPIENTYK